MLRIENIPPLSNAAAGKTVESPVFTLGGEFGQVESKSLDASTALIAQRPVDPAEFAPNGFGDDSLGLIEFIHQLSIDTRAKLDQAFRVDGFEITEGLPEEAFQLADLHVTFPNSSENGTSGLHDPSGTSYAWIASDQSQVATQMGVPEQTAVEVVAAQEAMHSIVRAHPELRGKFTTEENEVMGELASLAVAPEYDIITLRNALMGYPTPGGDIINPEYSLISENVISAVEMLFDTFEIDMSGGNFLNDYVLWNVQQPGSSFGANSVSHNNLRAYLEDRLGIDPDAFMSAFPGAIFDSFQDSVHDLLRRKRAMPNL